MPLPTKRTGEKQSKFITRCMGDTTTVKEFPDAAKRRAVCQSQWNKSATSASRPSRVAAAFSGAEFEIAGHVSVNDQGQPIQRFKKDMISVGVYRHPFHEWTMDVTTDRLDRWIATFSGMRENGIDVEVVVDHSMEAEAVRGYLVDMFREGDTLFGIHELIGEDAIKLAQTVKNVSVLIDREYVDGKGNSYGEAITHSSIVQQPVVPGQEGFIPIAASRGVNSPASIFVYSTEGNKHTQEKIMDAEMLTKVREILGAGEDFTEENMLTRLAERIQADTDNKLSLTEELTKLKGEVEALKSKDAKGTAASTVDPDVLDERAETAEEKFDGLVEKSKITPKVAASLKDIFIGQPNERKAYMLSRKVSGTDESIVRKVVKALEENDHVELGEKTKSQALSRIVPDAEFEPDEKETKRTGDIAIESAGMSQPV